jgi:hypothetical protein
MSSPHASGHGALTADAAMLNESSPMPPLLNKDDYGSFANLDLDYWLAAVGDRVRRYLGWHLFPSLTTTSLEFMTGDGTILLPTRHLTNVVQVSPPWDPSQQIDCSAYVWDRRGWIRFLPMAYGYAPTPASADLWPIDTARLFDAYPKHNRRMSVTFTHGYPEMPPSVAEVCYEVAMRAMEKPAGVATQVQAGPYNFKFQEFGIVLSDDQKNRLSHYKLPGIW